MTTIDSSRAVKLFCCFAFGIFLAGCARNASQPAYVISEVVADVYIRDDNPPALTIGSAYVLLAHAGPSVTEELLAMVHSDNPRKAIFAGVMLRQLARGLNEPKWPNVLPLIHRELATKPEVRVARHLLPAASCEWIRGKAEFAHDALPYLEEEEAVNTVFTAVAPGVPSRKVEMRVCDYAAFIIKTSLGLPRGTEGFERVRPEEIPQLRQAVMGK